MNKLVFDVAVVKFINNTIATAEKSQILRHSHTSGMNLCRLRVVGLGEYIFPYCNFFRCVSLMNQDSQHVSADTNAIQ
jgi:hypothetical protein